MKILKNFLSLGAVQVSSYLVTLITMPYLIKTLGLEGFGLIVLSQTLVGYFIIFIDYGFSLTGTKYISENRTNEQKINGIVSEILLIKIFCFAVGLVIYTFIIFAFPTFRENKLLFIITYFMSLGNVFFPVYYFQGLEKMHVTALFNIIPKLLALVFIFIFVKTSDDLLTVALITTVGFTCSGVLSLLYSIFLGVRLHKTTVSCLIHRTNEAKEVFLGMLSSNISTNSIVLILGLLTTPVTVGAYSAVEKFIKPVGFFSNTLMQVIYPHMVKLKSMNLDFRIFSLKVSIIYILLLSFGLLIYKFILIHFLGYLIDNTRESESILNILIFLPLIPAILNSYFIPILLVEGENNLYAKSLSASCIVSLIFIPIFITLLGVYGAALAALIIELLKVVFIVFYNQNRKYKC
ncbi:oligosaccharide flippase family protein [Vibrio splendidus]